MDDKIVFGKYDARKTVTIDEVELLIVATCIEPMEWSVRVENDLGVRTEWFEFYVSAEAAIRVAQLAIEEEGVDAFVNIEGFEYLDHLNKLPSH